jgi:hypothetical protein
VAKELSLCDDRRDNSTGDGVVPSGVMPTDFCAIGNWGGVGDESAPLFARHGARLLHRAPAPGVQPWSDLRIGVAAGTWLGAARAEDRIDMVSDDRAFDAVGDMSRRPS